MADTASALRRAPLQHNTEKADIPRIYRICYSKMRSIKGHSGAYLYPKYVITYTHLPLNQQNIDIIVN